MLNPIAGNCFKQIMHKMGFTDWVIPYANTIGNMNFKRSPQSTMIIGVAVSLDKKLKTSYGKQPEGKQSMVGFVSSWDAMHYRYSSWVSPQGTHEQQVAMSRQMMKNAMIKFGQKNKKYPANVIVYRDGVGDSQLEKFVRVEMQEYINAFRELKTRPKLTVIVCQKRGQARFFQECPSHARKGRCHERRCNGRDPYHSPQAGIVVDSDIVSPLFSDFYLVPSLAPPGACARPTRFIVLKDEMNWASDDIQNLTNQMCYGYLNWPGPIRVPAPVMYATKLAYLFGKHVNGTPNKSMCDKLFYL